jgi:hypothetical protein
MLEMGLREPDIARLPEATPADALCMSTLDPGPRRILPTARFRHLPLPGGLQRLIRLTRLEPYNAWLLLGPSALRPMRTRRAVLAGKAHLGFPGEMEKFCTPEEMSDVDAPHALICLHS